MPSCCRFSTTYAVPASNFDGATLHTVPQGGRFGMFLVTLVQCAPPSCVTCTWPSVLPVQITPAFAGDSAIAYKVAPSNVVRLSEVMPPELPWCDLSLVVRSGLITVQLWPPLVVMKTTCAPT